MAPSTTAPKSVTIGTSKKSTRLGGSTSTSREATPIAAKPVLATMATKGEAELAGIFKSDLTNIRNLVTCSICDQLLYEPWTLACGHTYCYSCLCNWFVPNKRKKTCPECRTRVKNLPGPNFLVKQMVEIFTKRTELMPADESVEQHNKKRSEEIAEVEKDRNGPAGLFKGTFPSRRAELFRDEEDNVMRCPECGHEHEGGPACENCGVEIQMDDFFSDLDEDLDDDFDTDEMEGALDIELDAEFEEMQRDPYFHAMGFPRRFVQHFHHHHHHPHARDAVTNTSDGDSEGGSDEDEGSLHEFVVPDDEEPIRRPGRNPNRPSVQQPITISDDEDSDEGGAVSNRRPRRRGWQVGNSTPSAPSVVTLTDTSVNDSEAGDEAEMLRHAGWSPLDQGNDSDADGHVHLGYDGHHAPYDATEDERDSDDESDTNTETMVGNGFTDDDDDDRVRDESSLTPTYSDYPHPPEPTFVRYSNFHGMHDEHFENYDDHDDSELEQSIMDRDGDTEMSASPRASRSSRSVSITTDITNPYDRNPYSESRSGRSVSVSTNHGDGEASESFIGDRGESIDTESIYGNLGVANEIHEVENQSSDSSVRPPPRRLPRRYHPNSRAEQYDPRISMIFAEHQQSLRGTQNNPIGLDEWDGEVRRVEPASRHRRVTAYRTMPPRRVDPLRSSRSPSATRIISVADRSSRIPRQYVRRN